MVPTLGYAQSRARRCLDTQSSRLCAEPRYIQDLGYCFARPGIFLNSKGEDTK